MIKFNVTINNGNEYLGTEGKTITVNEDVKTVDNRALARQINLHNPLLPISLLMSMIEEMIPAIAELMALGYVIQLKYGDEVMLRIGPDVKVNTPTYNINLAKAREIDSSIVEITAENAGDLVDRTGVTLRVKADVQQKFTELLRGMKPPVRRENVIERDRITRTDSTDAIDTSTGTIDTSTGTVDTSTGSNTSGGDDIPTGNG